jgi:hypothetical protein
VNPEDGGNKLLRNVGNQLSNYRLPKPRTLIYEHITHISNLK